MVDDNTLRKMMPIEALQVFDLSYVPTPEVERRASLHEKVRIEIGAADSYLQRCFCKDAGLVSHLPEEGLQMSP